ncbi:thiolase family protein [Saccharopolyspora sp. K220]|uniref:thiolase family protein n=1 Tax=Saccharopolyspora soli TaxID=2926618 RepID=UPI001F58A926|nr:thiolase family protein [Saccharopolyspora soli]MCI2420030.1 thiolase family protein [Saccharopolyspora soli]
MDLYISGAAVTPFGKFPGRTIPELATEAVDAAIADAGCEPGEIGFAAFGNAASSMITGQAMIQGQLALLDGQLAGAQIVNVENACASSSTAVQLAMMAVRSGQCDTALAVGAEKLSHPDKTRAFAALGAAVDVTVLDPDASERNSVFMNLYAAEARRYLAETGAPVESLAHAAATVRFHGSRNPKAQYREAYMPEEILASRMIDDPLTLLMCSPIGDGAAAVVVTNRRPAADAVAIRGAALRSARRQEGGGLVTRVTELAFAEAGLRPSDVDVVELHDAAASAALVILEEMGIVGQGEAWKLAMDGQLRFDGAVPVNPSGGLISRGHPVGATGCAQLVELVDQLRGRCGDRQVPNARIAAAQNAGGAVTLDDPYTAAVCAVTVLERR